MSAVMLDDRQPQGHNSSDELDVLDEVLHQLRPVDRAAANERASLQARHDRKYVVDRTVAAEAISACDPLIVTCADRRWFTYTSEYFDTPDYQSYLDAAHSRPRRFKVRVRQYDDGSRWWEVKLRDGRGTTVKHRIAEPDDPDELQRFLGSFPDVRAHLPELEPSLTTTYRRATVITQPAHGHVQRATIDDDVHCTPIEHDHPGLTFGSAVIVETKSPTAAPGPIDRTLWALGMRPVKVSKYGVGIANATGLPANKWHRVITRHTLPESAS